MKAYFIKGEVNSYENCRNELRKLDKYGLMKRSYELLNKIRKAWNEKEYREWCAIQETLYTMMQNSK
ncbi:hypothetical protein [Sphingobacterium sp. LRF_L2]|uniref:hypothetical protein n=1 Tax=Sphingobacterium sp. LRF_L2 TaxID=3369421 RepID=UPI003F5F1A96